MTGTEEVSPSLQLLLDLGVVLDDAVVDDGDVARAVEVGVGVRRLRGAVGRPAGVSDSREKPLGRQVALQAQRLYRLGTLGGAGPPGLPGAHQGNPCRVVAPILQARQALKQRLQGVAGAHDSDDAAHEVSLLGSIFDFSERFRRTAR